MVAVTMMLVVLGIAALILEGSFLFEQRNRLSSVADAAAKAAALELARHTDWQTGHICPSGDSACTALNAFAATELAHSDLAAADVTLTLNHPPLTGPYAGDGKFVEVLASRNLLSFFGGFVPIATFHPTGRAVAGAGANPICIVALNQTTSAGPQSLVINLGNGTLGNPGCPLVANNNIHVNNGTSITTSPVTQYTPAGWTQRTCGDNAAICAAANIQHASGTAPDPFATLPVPSAPVGVPCTNPFPSGFNQTYNTTMPGGGWQCYSQVSMASGCTINFAPGHYYLTGNWNTGFNCTFTGSGVFFYFAGASATISWSSATANLSAITSTADPYAGILIYMNRANSAGTFNLANSDLHWDGAMYAKLMHMSFGGATQASTDCSIIVGGWISFNNGGTIRNGCAAYGGTLLSTKTAIAE